MSAVSSSVQVAEPPSPPHLHDVHFYDGDRFPSDETAAFIGTALRQGGVGIVIARNSRLQALRALLASDLKEADSPNLIALDARDTLDGFMVDGRPDPQRFHATVGKVVEQACTGARQVHAFGEMVAMLCEEGAYEAALQLEILWNALARQHAFSLLCAYSFKDFDTVERASIFEHICNAHGRVRLRELSDAGTRGTSHVRAALRQRTLALERETHRRGEAETAVEERDKELADFVENAAEGLHKVNADGVILWANRAELNMLGYEWNEYVGQPIAKFHVDQVLIADILARLTSGETLCDQPARLLCKDGSVKHVLIQSNAHFKGGRLQYTRCFTRDATAHVEREKLLQDLAKAGKAKDEFLAMLGHELRNPLAPIVTALRLMRMRGDTATSREQGIIERQVEHLVRLVDDLLDVSRLTTGKIELRRSELDLGEVLTKAVEMSSSLLEKRSHRFSASIEPALRLKGDASRLAQVVANLLTNAAKYTGIGGEIHLRAWRSGPDAVSISVSDNGVGIAPDALPHVFEMFYQVKQNIDRAEGGLGIGLALARNLVELHGGSLRVASEGPGRGSMFVVELPAASVAAPLRFETSSSAEEGALEAPRVVAPSAKLVVVDDNVDHAILLGELLSNEGFDVRVYHDPLEALVEIRKDVPDIAILDIGLPEIDGYELAKRIKTMPEAAKCKFIALTGYGQREDVARSKASGFQYHVVKATAPAQLVEAIGKAMNERSPRNG